MVGPFLPDEEKLAAIREALPATSAGIYLNTGTAGPLPRETARAMTEVAEYELTVGRAHGAYWEDTKARFDEARATIAAIIHVGVPSIALTHCTSEGLNVAIWSIDYRAGDRVVTTNQEHPGLFGPLVALRDRLGVELVPVDVTGTADETDWLGAFDEAIEPGTRLVAISHVLWGTGARLPVDRIVELARSRGAVTVIDGAQAAGAIPVDVGAVDPDFYALPAQKWLCGPEGAGALYMADRQLAVARQTFAGGWNFDAIDPAVPSGTTWPDARRFDALNFHKPAIVGMARSCGWLSMYVGLDWVHRRGARLARAAVDALAEVSGVRVLTPVDRMGTLVSFRIDGWPAERAAEELSRRVFLVARSVGFVDAVRLSVGFFTTEAEIERVVEAVSELARFTPETLPPRPVLTILRS